MSVGDPPDIVLPLCEEKASIVKQRTVTARVTVSRVTHEREQLLNATLLQEHVEIDRIPIGRPVECIPNIHEEGDDIVIPVVEEILVVQRRLVLKEEIRVRRVRNNESHRERLILRCQEVLVTRDPLEQPIAAHAAQASSTQTAS